MQGLFGVCVHHVCGGRPGLIRPARGSRGALNALRHMPGTDRQLDRHPRGTCADRAIDHGSRHSGTQEGTRATIQFRPLPDLVRLGHAPHGGSHVRHTRHVGPSGAPPIRAENAHGDPTAWTACQEAVRGHLKAPATARFTAPMPSPGVAAEETQIIAAAVDAQQSDGAWRRSRFVCEANLVGADWIAHVVFVKE
jgi:hypothetical protein